MAEWIRTGVTQSQGVKLPPKGLQRCLRRCLEESLERLVKRSSRSSWRQWTAFPPELIHTQANQMGVGLFERVASSTVSS